MPQAASLAVALKEAFGIEAHLIEGSGGVFDVKLDGVLIYSKDETGCFPDNAEIVKLVRDRQS